jgi:hypothetical protein
MIPQQPSVAPLKHQADTVRVLVPKAVDSLKVRITSGTVQVPDTIHAVVRQKGGMYEWATLALTLALILVTFFTQRRSSRLQRDFNDMQAQHERERREADQKRDDERRRAVDAKISGVAYVLRRQLNALLEEAPGEVHALIAVVDTWVEQTKKLGATTEEPPVTGGMEHGATEWAGEHSGGPEIDRAEVRFAELVSAAPEASQPVARAIRSAFVLFYRAMERWQRAALVYYEVGAFEGVGIVTGYHQIERCVEALAYAIGTELLDAEAQANE